MIPTLPTFARVEIRLADRDDLYVAAEHLRSLAGELDEIAGTIESVDDARVVAHHRIRSVSQKLRPGAAQ